MDKKGMMFGIITMTFIMAVIVFVFATNSLKEGSGSALQTIHERINFATGEVRDTDGVLGYKGPDSVSYELMPKNKGLWVYFGKIKIKVTNKQLKDQKFMKEFHSCLLDIKSNDGIPVVTFKGKEVRRIGTK